MKVQFNYGIKTYSGTVDDMTFGAYRKGTICIARKHVIPHLTENNTEMGSKLKNLATIYASLSSGYKNDLKTYAVSNAANVAAGKLPPTSFAIFVKMMYLFSELDEGHVDLTSLTYTDLQTLGEDISSIATAVGNGYLDEVEGAELLTNSI
jgi:hypothetical protein